VEGGVGSHDAIVLRGTLPAMRVAVASALLVLVVSGCGLGAGWSSYGPETATSEGASPVDPLVDFARNQSEDTWALAYFADRVDLGLAGGPLVRRSGKALMDAKAWEIDKHLWRGEVGPFSAIETLGPYRGELAITMGPHDRHCSSESIPVPKRLRGLQQWSIQPADPENCSFWFAVDVWMNNPGEMAAVMLDRWEP